MTRAFDYWRAETGRVPDWLEEQARYSPEFADGLTSMRRAAFDERTLPPRLQETVTIALEVMQGNARGAATHATRAVEGALLTPPEVMGIALITTYMSGITAYTLRGGGEAVRAAEAAAASLDPIENGQQPEGEV